LVTRTLRLVCLTILAGCASYRPAPLSLRVISVPGEARAELRCPNVDVQNGTTPVKFRVPQYATPCQLTFSRDGYRDKRVDVTWDMLQQNPQPYVAPAPERIHFTEEATPFSLLGALIRRSVENLGARVAERVASTAIPDATIEVVLEPVRP